MQMCVVHACLQDVIKEKANNKKDNCGLEHPTPAPLEDVHHDAGALCCMLSFLILKVVVIFVRSCS